MNMALVKNNKYLGFTLAETVVVIGLFAVMLVYGVGILIWNNRFYNTQSGEIRAINSTRNIADFINEYGRLAVQIEPSRTFNSVAYTSDSTGVIFRVPAVDDTGEIIDNVYDYIFLSQDPNLSNRFLLIVDADLTSDRGTRTLELSDALSAVNFSYDNADLSISEQVDYEIVITHPGKNPATEKVVGTVTIRN